MGCTNSKSEPKNSKKSSQSTQLSTSPNPEVLNRPTPRDHNNMDRLNETASQENINQFYQQGKQIGKGSFGEVYLMQSRYKEDRQFAIKSIAQKKMQEKEYMLKRELEILKVSDHPNIVKFYEIFQTEKDFQYVIEYCQGGDLFSYMKKHKRLNEKEAAKIMRQTFSAVAHLHANTITHRDIKPENILFQNSNVKIIDFGLSRIHTHTQQNLGNYPGSVVGTPLYVAPEIILSQQYGTQCDNWSLGVVMYYLLSGNEPFFASTLGDVYEKIKSADFDLKSPQWAHISNSAKNLIRELLVLKPEVRITAEEALKHDWFKENLEVKEYKKYDIEQQSVFIRNILDNGYDKQQPKIKREIAKIILNHHIGAAELENLENAFSVLDNDSDGKLSYSEIRRAMQLIGMSAKDQERIKQAFRKFGQFRNKSFQTQDVVTSQIEQKEDNIFLYQQEFMMAAIKLSSYEEPKIANSIFGFFDVHKNDEIRYTEIANVIAREGRLLKDEELKEYIFEVCQDKEGIITFDMFKYMLKQNDMLEIQKTSVRILNSIKKKSYKNMPETK